MKRLWLAVSILVIIVAFCLTAILYQQRKTVLLLEQLDAVNKAFDDQQMDTAYTLAKNLENDYQRHVKVFSYFMAHGDLAECRESIALLPAILQEDNPEEFRMESSRCRAILERLSTTELPLWQNIL